MLDLTKVSVIVPVYNVEDYLRECLDSLINQSLDDIEIICVNDGSTDSSMEILKEYEDNPKIRIYSQDNAGLSAARNTGLEHVNGQYIYFIDSDDILCENALERLYETAEEKSLDMVIFKIINFDDETYERFSSKYYDMEFLKETVMDNVFSSKDVYDVIFSIAVSIPSKFFKSNLIKEMNFIEGYIFEDNPFFIEAFLKAERVCFLDEYLYLRRERSGSITSSHNDKFFDFIPIANILIDITKKYGVYENCRESLFKKILTNYHYRLTQVDDEYKEEFFKRIKEDLLAKKEELDNDEVFQNSPERLKEIFYSGIKSQNAREFELSIERIDLNRYIERLQASIERRDVKIQRRESKISELRADKVKLINNSRRLSDKINKLAYNNKGLKKENENYKKENENLQYVNSQIMQSNSWKLTKPLRSAGSKVKK